MPCRDARDCGWDNCRQRKLIIAAGYELSWVEKLAPLFRVRQMFEGWARSDSGSMLPLHDGLQVKSAA